MSKMRATIQTKGPKVTFDDIIAQTLKRYSRDLLKNVTSTSVIWSKLKMQCEECGKKIDMRNSNLRKQKVCSKKCLKLKKIKLLK